MQRADGDPYAHAENQTMRTTLVLGLLSLATGGCQLMTGITPCLDGGACPDGQVCNAELGVCQLPAAAGDAVDGTESGGGEGEGEGDRTGGEGEGDVVGGGEGEGEGEGDVIGGGEGEGEGDPLPVPVEIFTCGDGRIDAGEACDDGNRLSGDACSSTCRVDGNSNLAEPNGYPEDNNRVSSSSVVLVGQLEQNEYDPQSDSFWTEADGAWLDGMGPVVRAEVFDSFNGDDCSGSAPFWLDLGDATQPYRMAFGNGARAQCATLTSSVDASAFVQLYEDTGVTPVSYRLQLTQLSDRGVEIEPNDTPAVAENAADTGLDVFMSGTLGSATDVDVYAIRVPAGRGLRAEVIPTAMSVPCDRFNTRIALLDDSGVEVISRTTSATACPFLDGTGAQAQNVAAKNTAGQGRVMYVAVKVGGEAFAGAQAYRVTFTVR